jgi:uncharacterized protein YdhG (YjbR/CyaY superfamily)
MPRITAHVYFERLPEEHLMTMARIRHMMRKQWPDHKEDMRFGMPTYHLNGQPLFAMASKPGLIIFYVLPAELLDHFKHDLRTRNHGKRCIRFREVTEPDMELLERIVKYVGTTFTGVATHIRGLAKAR